MSPVLVIFWYKKEEKKRLKSVEKCLKVLKTGDFIVLVLLSTSVNRVGVSRMRDLVKTVNEFQLLCFAVIFSSQGNIGKVYKLCNFETIKFLRQTVKKKWLILVYDKRSFLQNRIFGKKVLNQTNFFDK